MEFVAPLPGPAAMRFVEEQIYAATRRPRGLMVYINYFMPAFSRRPGLRNAVLIHDCQHRVFPENFSVAKRLWLDITFRHSLDHADHVLSISRWEVEQIAKYFGDSRAERCRVIYNAIDWDRFGVAPPTEEPPPHRYILSVCHQYPHKNIETLVRAFARLNRSWDSLHLYLVGNSSVAVREICKSELDQAVASKVHLLNFVSDSVLGALYRNASLFVLPSLYEGFGMPIVEAIGMGVPAVISDAGALPEVAGRHSIIVPSASSAAEWADAISSALDNPPGSERLMSSASEVRAFFSTEAVAARLAAAVEQR